MEICCIGIAESIGGDDGEGTGEDDGLMRKSG